jgi:hypothetical protein
MGVAAIAENLQKITPLADTALQLKQLLQRKP